MERLDKGFANNKWLHLFPKAKLMVLPKTHSDHNPLLLDMNFRDSQCLSSFKFETMWTYHPKYNDLIHCAWEDASNLPLLDSIKFTTDKLQTWNKQFFGNIFKQKQSLLKQLYDVKMLSPLVLQNFCFKLRSSFMRLTTLFFNKNKNFGLVGQN